MSKYNIFQMLSSLPCHFTWEQLQLQNVGRTVQMNIKNLEEHIEETIQGTEVESYNLMGFYKTLEKSFIEARRYFNKALEKTKREDEKIVGLACLAWLTWKEESSDSSSQDQILEKFNEVKRMLRGRDVNNIPEVMAEKAFSIANSGFTESGFQEALVCIDRALTERPDNVMFKFTKVFVMQKLHEVRKKYVDQKDTTVDEIKQLWEEIIETLKDCPGLSVMYGKALIQYALLLAKINRYDNGSSGKKYAEKAEEVASSNHGVMRNVATFYINTTRGQQVSKLEKAEVILKKIVREKKNGSVYKELSQLGQLLLKKYKIKPNEETFVEAKDCLRESWDVNKKYIISALDLSRLYQEKYIMTKEITALVEAEKILFHEIFSYSGELDETNKAYFYTGYANLLKNHGPMLASHHEERATSSLNDGMTAETTDDTFEQVLKLLHQYADDRDDTKLLKAEKKFREMYGNLEKLRDQYQARFHKEYGMFLEKYSKDLAFYYLLESLQYNPHQRREYSYIPLESLAKEKIARPDTEEKRKGYEALEMMRRLQQN